MMLAYHKASHLFLKSPNIFPPPTKHSYNAVLRVENNLTSKITKLAHFNATDTEAGWVVWDTLYNVGLRIMKEEFLKKSF